MKRPDRTVASWPTPMIRTQGGPITEAQLRDLLVEAVATALEAEFGAVR